MPEQKVTITAEIITRGLEEFKRVSAELGVAQQKTREYEAKIKQLSAAHERHESVLRKAGAAIKAFRRELFAISFAAAATIGTLVALAKSSNDLGVQLERGGNELQRFGKNLGDLVAKSGVLNPIIGMFKVIADLTEKINKATGPQKRPLGETKERGILSDSLTVRTLQSQGRTREALELQLDIEFLQRIQDELAKGGQGVDRLKQAWMNYRKEAVDALRRTELGLKNANEIAKEFQRNFIQITKGGISDLISGAATGEFSGKDAGKKLFDFAAGIGKQHIKNIADTIAEAITSKAFGGQSFSDMMRGFFGLGQTEKAAEATRQANMLTAANTQAQILGRMEQTLLGIQNCTCTTAANTSMIGRGGGPQLSSISITGGGGGGSSALGKIGSIFGGIAGIAGGISGGLGGLKLGGWSGATGAGGGSIQGNTQWGGFSHAVGHSGGWVRGGRFPVIRHSGGWIPRRFDSGGEVPAVLQAGEFVVNRSSAMANKDTLKEINQQGARPVKRSGGNVFLIKANDAASFSDQLASPSARNQMEVQLMKLIMTNSQIRKVIQDFTK